MAKAPEGPAAEAPKAAETGMDVGKLLAKFDPTALLSEMTGALKKLNMPGLDVDAMVAAQKRNMEAVIGANRAMFEGAQAVMRRQVELMQEAMNQAMHSVRDLGTSASPPDVVAKQAELAKQTFEKASATLKELGEIVTKSNSEAASIIHARIGASLGELQEMLLKLKK